jgi:hypothetical protein
MGDNNSPAYIAGIIFCTCTNSTKHYKEVLLVDMMEVMLSEYEMAIIKQELKKLSEWETYRNIIRTNTGFYLLENGEKTEKIAEYLGASLYWLDYTTAATSIRPEEVH